MSYNTTADFIIPAVIMVIANVFSGNHESRAFEKVTAIFGWTSIICIILYLFLDLGKWNIKFAEIAAFCLITALSRDYEKMIVRIKRLFSKK